jgi:AcrR family transcriptional regulator
VAAEASDEREPGSHRGLLTGYGVRSIPGGDGSTLSTVFAMGSSRGVIWERPERASRGPAPAHSREEITAAAVRLADTQGIEAVSMRAIAVELGVGAASLYRYVARKDELIELMVETLDAYVRGRVLEELSEQEAVRRSGLDQEQWMQTQIPYIESLIESGHYPVLTRVVLDARAPHNPDRLKHGFDLGLERVLDGLATMLPT